MSSAFNIPAGYALVSLELLDRFPEINPSNYDHDDACKLNAWGVELVLSVSAAPPVDAVPGEPVDADRVRRLAEDWAEDCVMAGYVTTVGCKSYRPMVDAINSLAASVASRAGSEPVASTDVEAAIDAFIEDYEMLGEAEDGRDASYSPNENDRALLKDGFMGLLADDRVVMLLRRCFWPAIAPAAAAEQSERCAKCGGRDIPWGHGKCHCFKNTKDNDGREQHGADAEGVAQVGGADAGTDRLGARPGANVGDQHRGTEAADHGHAGYSLGEEVRLPSRRELQEGIDLTPEPEDLRALAASVASRAGSEPVPGLVRMTDEDAGRVTLQFDCDESAQAFQLGHDCTVDIDEWSAALADIAPAAAAEPSEPAQEAAEHDDDGLLTGQAQYLIGALMGHGLLARSMPEDQYLKLWDVVKRQLRCVNREGARAASPNPQDSATPDRERAASLAASEDTKRLDWLEKGAEKSKSLGYQWDAFTFNFAKYSTIREALDAAMNNPKAPNA